MGCYGDGGALYTNDSQLAQEIKMIANHGQSKKYHHQLVGVNSRLDSIQAAVLSVKLKHLNEYEQARQNVASYYDQQLSILNWLSIPTRLIESTHVFHQYTLLYLMKLIEIHLSNICKNVEFHLWYIIQFHCICNQHLSNQD